MITQSRASRRHEMPSTSSPLVYLPASKQSAYYYLQICHRPRKRRMTAVEDEHPESGFSKFSRFCNIFAIKCAIAGKLCMHIRNVQMRVVSMRFSDVQS